MALTPERVAQVHRALEDPGPDPTWAYHADGDYAALVRGLIASHPSGLEIWLFAYGSLIWKPELEHVEMRQGTARGWHRSFCFRVERFSGTRDQPGLMMSLDRGGQCHGVVFRLAPDNLEGQLGKLVRREMTVKPPNNIPRWIRVETDHGPLRAIAFVMNRQSRFYTGRLAQEEIADVLAKACGHWGPAPSISTTRLRTSRSKAYATGTFGACKPSSQRGSGPTILLKQATERQRARCPSAWMSGQRAINEARPSGP